MQILSSDFMILGALHRDNLSKDLGQEQVTVLSNVQLSHVTTCGILADSQTIRTDSYLIRGS